MTRAVLVAAVASAVLLLGGAIGAPDAFAAGRVAPVTRVARIAPLARVAPVAPIARGVAVVAVAPVASTPAAEPVRQPVDPSPPARSGFGAWPLVVLAASVAGSFAGGAITRRLARRRARRA